MAYRNLIIENAAEVSARNGQLIIVTDNRYSLPIEDINSILLENRFTTVSTHALSVLAQDGVTVYVCDEKHLPCAVMLPYMQNSRGTEIVRLQLAATLPQKKRLWQQVVTGKVSNQARCLRMNRYTVEADFLEGLAVSIQSGDPKNIEAQAANYYFKVLFGQTFTRDDDCIVNAALNYGYAIMRGQVAKLICVYGLLPVMGIHHNSTLNSFNLADDMMEPLRPVVDLYVSRAVTDCTSLNTELKRNLYNLLNMDMQSGEYNYTVAYAAERMVQSLIKSLKTQTAGLVIPRLVALHQHTYE